MDLHPLEAALLAVLTICLFVGMIVMLTDLRPIPRRSSQRKATMLFGVMEKSNGVRTWLTPFDIHTYQDALDEALRHMNRDSECEYCIIYFQKDGEVPREFFKVTRP